MWDPHNEMGCTICSTRVQGGIGQVHPSQPGLSSPVLPCSLRSYARRDSPTYDPYKR